MILSSKNKITKDENRENVLHLEIAEVVLVNNDHQQNSGALYNHVSNKLFDELLDI